MNKASIPIYIGFGLMVIAIILQIIASALAASLDKFSTIPNSYRNMMYSSVVIFFIGLVIVMFGVIGLPSQ